MDEPGERLRAAVDDLFGAPREKRMASASVPRLSGIRELYLNLTGDYDMHGGYFPERAQLATTSDFTGLVKAQPQQAGYQHLGGSGQGWL